MKDFLTMGTSVSLRLERTVVYPPYQLISSGLILLRHSVRMNLFSFRALTNPMQFLTRQGAHFCRRPVVTAPL